MTQDDVFGLYFGRDVIAPDEQFENQSEQKMENRIGQLFPNLFGGWGIDRRVLYALVTGYDTIF